MRARMEQLYPICRSITGDGVRRTLDLIGEALSPGLALTHVEVPSGTAAHDWTVNEEWNVRGAWIADMTGRRLVDFQRHNLHLVSYSTPVRARMWMDELRPHLHTLPEHPDWIPYRTTYYHRTWGFCLTQRQLDAMGQGPFDVEVDATLEPGRLTYGELVIPGETDEEILFTAHVCHPSLANDNLSGIVVAVELANALAALPRRRFSYRFVFAPGTIGSITWLSRNSDRLARIRHGLVLTGLGGPGPLVYKRTRQGDRPIDRAATHVVRHSGGEVRDYSPYGYDERQFNSIGFDLPVGRLSRTPHGEYPEYHTSADNLGFVKDEELLDAYAALLRIVEILEHDAAFTNLSPHGEPQLGKRGLYPTTGGKSASDTVMAMLWTLGYSDGRATLLDIADRADLEFATVCAAATDLARAGLLKRADEAPAR
jgi:aminopeptidase-like protein